MKTKQHILALATFIVALSYVSARASSVYIEDFTSTANRHGTLNTTEWSTGDGEMRLPEWSPSTLASVAQAALDVALVGDRLFTSSGPSGVVEMFDVSDPTNPTSLGANLGPGTAFDFDVSGGFVYVVSGTGGLRILDYQSGVLVSRGTYVGSGAVLEVDVQGYLAYTAWGVTGMRILDVTDPDAPAFLGGVTVPDGVFDIAVAGDVAYTASRVSGFITMDVSDPTAPSILDIAPTPWAHGIAVAGNHAFVLDDSSGLLIFDVTDPAAVAQVGSLALPTPTPDADVAVSGNYLYVLDSNGVDVVDVSDPASPVVIATVAGPGGRGISVDGNRAAAAHVSSFELLEIAQAVTPEPVGSVTGPAPAEDVAVSGDRAYVAAGTAGIVVYDVSDPANPAQVGTFDTGGTAHDVAVDGDLAYVADGSGGVVCLDVSTDTPALLGSLALLSDVLAVALSGNLLFASHPFFVVEVIDVEDPATPTSIGTVFPNGIFVDDLVVWGDRLLAGSTGSLHSIDVADPASPAYVGSTLLVDRGYDVAVSGTVAYVADGVGGLQAFDLYGLPGLPAFIDNYPTSDARAVTVAGNLALVDDAVDGLLLLDISDPTAITLVGQSPSGGGRAIALDGDEAYVATSAGLEVHRALHRVFALDQNAGHSIVIPTPTMFSASITTQQTPAVTWELSADGGSNWVAVTPGAPSVQFPAPGNQLMWRSLHTYTGGGVNPTVSLLEIDAMLDIPVIESIVDVPDDQGRQVRIEWSRSGYDAPGSGTNIEFYAIFREVDGQLKTGSDVPEPFAATLPPGDWDYLGSVPAHGDDTYAWIAPTLADGSVMNGPYDTTFLVRAAGDTPTTFFDSVPASGESVDNLAPAMPQGLVAQYTVSANHLDWDPALEPDLQYYKVYRSDVEGFVPDPANLLGTSATASFTDTSADPWYGQYYKVSTVDFSGNESPAAAAIRTDTPPVVDHHFGLDQNVPNPFNPATIIAYEVDSEGPVRLRVFDVAGRLVRSLVDEVQSPGRRSVRWDGRDETGRPVASGTYFYRLEAADLRTARKMNLVR